MSSSSSSSSGGVGLGSLLCVAFVVLKLTGHINWSWWWVCSPLWIPLAVVAAVAVMMFVTAAIIAALQVVSDRRARNRRMAEFLKGRS